MSNIKVAIADDHQLFIKGMEAIIERFDGIEMVMEAKNGEELLDKIKKDEPDVILMDLKMPVMDGMEATAIIRSTWPDIKIIALTMYDEEKYIIYMMRKGINGYLHKNAEPVEVEEAIHSVVENNFYFNDYVSRAMMKGLTEKKIIDPCFKPDADLSEREIEILQLICKEYNNKEIASELFISTRTVEGHREKLLEKTGARNTAGLVVYALKNDLVKLDLS